MRVARSILSVLPVALLAATGCGSTTSSGADDRRPAPAEDVGALKAELEEARRAKAAADGALEDVRRELERKVKELVASRETAQLAQTEARLSQELLIKQKKAFDKRLQALASHGPASDGSAVGSAALTATSEERAPSPGRGTLDLDLPIALIDGEPVTRREVAEALLFNFAHTYVDNYLNFVLALRESKRVGLSITDDEAEAYALEQLAVMSKQAGGDDKLDEQLQKSGLTRDAVLETLRFYGRSAVAVKKLALFERTTKEGRAWFEERARAEYDARYGERLDAKHFLVGVPQGATEEDWRNYAAHALRLREQLALGEDWNKVAAAAREALKLPVRADRQVFSRPNFAGVPELERAMYEAREGEVSQPLRSRAGISLFQVQKRVPAQASFEAKKDLIVSDLQKPEPSQEEQDRLFARLRAAARIEKRLELGK